MGRSYFNEDTIVAIATSPDVVAAVGVIRVSGPQCWSIVSQLLKTMDGGSFHPESTQSHRLYRCLVERKKGSRLDDGMFVWMKAPKSYTGEDVIEFHLHGNPYILNALVSELVSCGARAALPGEFSFRAFQNGKLTLNQAEAVSDLISTPTAFGAEWALEQLLGRSKPVLSSLKSRLTHCLAQVEVDIDFSDQGLSMLDYPEWAKGLEQWCLDVERLRRRFMDTIPLRDGIGLALVGNPNSGKSSLFNQLLDEDRSIVSDEAGTTRDVVRESVQISGLSFRLSDTAGIRETANRVESLGITRSFGEIRSANLVLWVIDGQAEAGLNCSEIREKWKAWGNENKGRFLAIWNKCDLNPEPGPEWMAFFRAEGLDWISLSARTGQGLPELKNRIISLFSMHSPDSESFVIGRMRHFEVLGRAVAAVRDAVAKVSAGEALPDLLSGDLREAISCLGEISGDFTTEDLLTHIFSEFCIGK